ncbi:unnamed protein product [Urochloa humidicola]
MCSSTAQDMRLAHGQDVISTTGSMSKYFAKLVELGRITVHSEAQEGCSSEEHGDSRSNVVGNTNFKVKLDVLVRTFKVLVGVVFVRK